jgi:hypothetical protein
MFVENSEGSLNLADCDELLCSLQKSQYRGSNERGSPAEPTLSTFSGLICGGGGMLGNKHHAVLGLEREI